MPEAQTHHAYFQMLIDGAVVSDAVTEHIKDIAVENTLHLPDVATIRVEDDNFELHTQDQFRIGKTVEVKFGLDKNNLHTSFKGEIVAADHDMAAHMTPSFVIRCYDKSHRLHRGRKRRSFQNVKDSDLVQRLASECGLTADATSTNEVHPYVFQNNQTNWEFINMLAQRNNYRTYVASDNKLQFHPISRNAEQTVELEWGKTLTSFRPRVSSSNQVPKVIVKSWDPKQKQGIVSEATTPGGLPEIGLISNKGNGGQQSSAAFGDAAMVIVDRVPRTQDGAKTYAQSVLDELSAGFVESDGLCQWHENLKPGCKIQCNNIGDHFSGKYFVTSTTHHFSPAEGLTTQFSVTGKKPATLMSAMGGGIHEASRLGGSVVVGIVTNNQDPEGKARVRVKFPWLSDEDESNWARLVSPMAGPGRGFQFIPEVGDEVLCAFEHGDITQPYVLGALWNGQDAPVENNSKSVTGEGVVRRSLQTRIGHLMLMDDTGGTGEVSFKTSNGHFVCLNDKDQQILLKTKLGHKIVLDDAGKNISIVDLTGANSIKIDSNGGNIDVNCTGSFSVTAAQGIKLTTPATFSMSATGTASLTAIGNMTISGAMVNIN